MESNWSKLFVNSDNGKRLTPLAIAFFAFQFIVILTIIVAIVWVNKDNAPDDDLARYEKMPELTIKGLADKAPGLSELEIKDIQKKLFKVVSDNTPKIETEKVEAIIRNDDTHMHTFDGKSTYLNMLIDIPSLEQTYEVIYSSNAVIDPDISTFVLCLEQDAGKIYENFDCKSSDSGSIRRTIVSAYLKYFRFEYFSAYISPDDPDKIIISPSVTYNNSQATKDKYIEEVKASIESLGMPSSIYDYYVRTAKDVDYENNE